jgi:predicted Zn-dependent protease
MKQPARAVVSAAVLGGVVLLFATRSPAQGHEAVVFSSGHSGNADERALGRAMSEQYMASSMPWRGARVNEYVNRVGQNLARASDTRNVFTFRVVYSPEVNARVFPGGYVIVNTGVISMAGSEAELAAVLAHEIAHVNARHGQRQRRRRQLMELLVVSPLAVGLGPLAMGASYGNALLAPLAEARFSRGFEREADALAARYLADAGYNPEGVARLLERLAV